MVVLAQRLTALLPDPLEVVFFCNSGSEANDLALRLARAYKIGSGGGKGSHNNNTIVVQGAYHGHTLANLEVSPYKYEKGTEYNLVEGKCGSQVPGSHIWKVPAPDTFRGPHRDLQTAGAQYAAYVQQACEYYTSRGETVRAFMVEGGMSVAGVILPPPGYLSACCTAVHAAGGLYIADEVQTGLGRLGTCTWAFQYHDPTLVPDIVTIGKPFGNGMPLAAVVTSRQVVERFEAVGVEYFNTFAGNPVCAAAGLAVLDEMEARGLQRHALEVGTYLKDKIRALMTTIDLIGDVRGSGFFIGIELITDRQSQTPATVETSYICSILKSKYHILTSIDGPADNVLVIKPPMVFSRADVDHFVACFQLAATSDLPSVDLSNLAKTPT
uniref:Uncharacterized protein n=1 Tax=Amphora coffeiformis TaxID=265554 RepID=A0A7S3PBL4_9STRA